MVNIINKQKTNKILPKMDNNVKDSIVNSVVEKYINRKNTGFKKYGVTMDRTDIDLKGWLIHLQEELQDATIYVEKLIQEVEKKNL